MKKEKRQKGEDDDSKGDLKVFNLRNVPKRLFYRMKMAAASEEQSPGEWIMNLAQTRIKELEQQGKLPRDS